MLVHHLFRIHLVGVHERRIRVELCRSDANCCRIGLP